LPNSGKRATAKGPNSDLIQINMTRSLESEVRIRTNIPKFVLKTRGGRPRSNVAYAHNAGGGSIQGGFAAHGETDLRPTRPPGLAPA